MVRIESGAAGRDVLQQSPELVQVVLEGSAGDEESGARVKDPHDLGEHRVDVLDSVCLVDDDVFPGELLESRLFAETELVRRDEHVERLGHDLGRNHRRLDNQHGSSSGDGTHSLLLVALEKHNVEPGHPALKLARPVLKRTLGHNHEMGTMDALVKLEVAEEGDGLQRLAESLGRSVMPAKPRTHHLVGEDAVDSVVVQPDHPVESLHLVLAHLTALDVWIWVSHVDRAGWADRRGIR